jgi:hypothetical protein
MLDVKLITVFLFISRSCRPSLHLPPFQPCLDITASSTSHHPRHPAFLIVLIGAIIFLANKLTFGSFEVRSLFLYYLDSDYAVAD